VLCADVVVPCKGMAHEPQADKSFECLHLHCGGLGCALLSSTYAFLKMYVKQRSPRTYWQPWAEVTSSSQPSSQPCLNLENDFILATATAEQDLFVQLLFSPHDRLYPVKLIHTRIYFTQQPSPTFQ